MQEPAADRHERRDPRGCKSRTVMEGAISQGADVYSRPTSVGRKLRKSRPGVPICPAPARMSNCLPLDFQRVFAFQGAAWVLTSIQWCRTKCFRPPRAWSSSAAGSSALAPPLRLRRAGFRSCSARRAILPANSPAGTGDGAGRRVATNAKCR